MTKKESKDKRINDILDAAIAEFVEKGYENTSMESIAARAGLTKGGVYYHFSSKDDILIKANERFMEPVMDIMSKASSKPRAAEGLAIYIEQYLTYWTRHPRELSFIFLTMTKTISDERLWNIYKGYTAQMTAFFEQMYQKGVTAKEFRPISTKSVAIALMAALDGIIGYLVIDRDLSLEKTIGDYIDTFIKSYKESTHERKAR